MIFIFHFIIKSHSKIGNKQRYIKKGKVPDSFLLKEGGEHPLCRDLTHVLRNCCPFRPRAPYPNTDGWRGSRMASVPQIQMRGLCTITKQSDNTPTAPSFPPQMVFHLSNN